MLNNVFPGMAVLLAMFGFAGVLFSESHFVFYFLLFLLGGISLLLIMVLVFDIKKANFFNIFGVAILLAYCLGGANTVLRLYFDGKSIFDYFDVDIHFLNLAIGLICFSVSFLFFWGKHLRSAIFDFLPKEITVSYGDVVIPLFVILLLLIAYATGQLGHQGVAVSDDATVSPFATLVVSLAIPSVSYCLFLSEKSIGQQKKVFLLLGIFLFCMLVPQGRRVLLYCVLQGIMALYLAGWKFELKNKKHIFSLFMGGLGLLLGSKVFYAMRIAKWTLGENTPFLEILSLGVDIFFNPDLYGLDEQISENVATRTFIIEYLGLLISRFSEYQVLFGGVMNFSLRMAMPSVLDGSKWEVLQYFAEEDFVHPHINLPYWDAANSVFTAGIADFYIIGMICYPVFFAALYRFVMRVYGEKLAWQVSFYFGFLFVNELLNVETVISAYFTTARNTLIAGLLLQIYYFARKTLRSA